MADDSTEIHMGQIQIAILNGICEPGDAISEVMLAQREILESDGHRVTLFAQYSSIPESETEAVRIAPNSWELLRDHDFRDADLAIFHFGMKYDLISLLSIPTPGMKTVLQFHNVTPPEFLDGPQQLMARQSLELLGLADSADSVWADSAYNKTELLEHCDLDEASVSVQPLFVRASLSEHPSAKAVAGAAPINVLSVGRVTKAKNQDVLLQALCLMPPEQRECFSIHFIGSVDHSPGYLAELQKFIVDNELERFATVHGQVGETQLAAAYAEATTFVSGSSHEGFCMPIIEALAAQCRVIATDAGATSDTLGGCGRLIAPLDPEAMCDALLEELNFQLLLSAQDHTAQMRLEAWHSRVQEHLRSFAWEAFAERTRTAVSAALGQVHRQR